MEFASMEDEQECEWAGRRQALAQLLQRRGHLQAAAIVAASHYRADYTQDDTYAVTLTVPAELYDTARTDFGDEIREACIDIVGSDDFGVVVYRVLTPPYNSTWIDTIVASLDNARWVKSERVPLPVNEALPFA
jgi:hypothetical protein